ncbi:MAG: FHA domain-containing protein [Candidatus Symbiothrix sp.]|jgi:uncharacterized Zn finger protein (UPF0148 family)|nr:FHA domain-containing protein [Candidatus Symbiothrix sp.]
MRCENCGWDNPGGNTKCEKCGVPLEQSFGDSNTPTVRQAAQGLDANGGFDLKKTVAGCPECGYPVRPGDIQCPQCGNNLGGNPTVPEKEEPKPKPSRKSFGGTVIKGAEISKDISGENSDKKTEEPARSAGKKIVGFLVTYSHTPLGEFFPLYEGRNFVGKSCENNAVIKGDDSVSGKHLSILYRAVDGKFKFKDEQSVNGTFINGELIDEGELANNDIIAIGSTKLVLMIIPKIE